ncbi:DUF3892 domain-containing protein [Bacillus sp. S/N-304-OC-R1]|uniref:DUF3892 domain-containing protein n=1 Tax=Bacillus sp. S/N-304-OC-R1 TaxID=2758034 RepID=UPI001C8EB06C|nr:DUF3892 domain-containing protein [Bacillus sp. S/N-304-OC-R1]MBY0122676.1 hypothetical protein [Bacillus sp. S/N-304-OC-R1]
MFEEQLVAVHRNYLGEIISFKTSAGRIISYQKALLEAEEGMITGVNIEESLDGQSVVLVPETATSFNEWPNMY